MKDSVIECISQQSNQIKEDDTLMKHDIKLQELSIRLDQIENILVKIQKKYPAYWDEIKI